MRHQAQYQHTHTHAFYWLVWEPAALIHGLVLSVSLTLAHFSLWRHPTASQAHWHKKKPAHVWVLRLTFRPEEGCGNNGGDWCWRAVLYGSVWCTQLLLFLWGDRHTILPLFRKTPFPCTQLAPPSPYQHHEQENTPHLFSVTPSASYHSNPHSEVGHINGKQSLHSSNSLRFWWFPGDKTNSISPESMRR